MIQTCNIPQCHLVTAVWSYKLAEVAVVGVVPSLERVPQVPGTHEI